MEKPSPHGRRTSYTREQADAIAREYVAAPLTKGARKAVADAYGVSQPLVAHWVARLGLRRAGDGPPTKYDLTPAQRDAIAKEYANAPAIGGHRLRIAEKYGVPAGLPYQWAKGRGLMDKAEKRAPPGQRKPRQPKPAKKPPVDLVAATNRAVKAMNGHQHQPGSKPGTFIREAILRLRSAGVEIQSVVVKDDACTITYMTKETFEL